MTTAIKRMRSNVVQPLVYETHNVPCVSVYRNTGGTFPDSTVSQVTWDAVEYDTDGMFSTTVGSRVTARTTGVYRVTAWWAWSANAAGERGLLVRMTNKAGTVQRSYPGPGVLGEGASVNATVAGLDTTQYAAYDIPLNAGDFIEVFVTTFGAGVLAFVAASLASRYNGLQARLVSTI